MGGSAHKVVAQSSVTALSKPAPPTMTLRVCVCVCVLGVGCGCGCGCGCVIVQHALNELRHEGLLHRSTPLILTYTLLCPSTAGPIHRHPATQCSHISEATRPADGRCVGSGRGGQVHRLQLLHQTWSAGRVRSSVCLRDIHHFQSLSRLSTDLCAFKYVCAET